MLEFHSLIVCIHHILLIHSSADGYLGCFCLLGTANAAFISLGHITWVELLDHMVLSCFRQGQESSKIVQNFKML